MAGNVRNIFITIPQIFLRLLSMNPDATQTCFLHVMADFKDLSDYYVFIYNTECKR